MPEPESKPPPAGAELRAEKERMLAEQEARRQRAAPLTYKHQANFAKALLAKLEGVSSSAGPARVAMSAPPPLANDHIPASADPEPVGGCFADIHDDTK